MTEREIFIAAFQQTNLEVRKHYLDETCGHDSALRHRIENLLELADQAGNFLEQPAVSQRVAASETTNTAPLNGKQIASIDVSLTKAGDVFANRYKLLEEIGDGGMGTVWKAEQSDPVRRTVALKLIKPGMDSKQVLVRFEAERQALAMMEHPNIARVYDAGTTADGRPFFVMELVNGIPITKYCDEYKLTPRQRLELFVHVCLAIQHAHQKGIIHRDIKPSNVLVAIYDDRPVPKVIDFGVAKATGPSLTEQTLTTGFGALIGTVEYMSPEQASFNSLDVDTRSDIYSLGVLLYELITGTTPLTRNRAKGVALLEVLRLVREEDPPKPSTRLSELSRPPETREDRRSSLASVAAYRHTEPAELTKFVRGELDWIVMKSLEKDRNRRYETANGFALDVQRYLADEAVVACPPTMGYRFRKFAKRNRRSLAVAGVFAVSLLVALGAIAGSLGWVARGQEARRLILEHEIVQALEETESWYRGKKPSESMAALKRAEGLLASGNTNDRIAERVRQWRTDWVMVNRLDEIRLGVTAAKDDQFDWAAADPAYRNAFRDYGLDITALDVNEAARRLRASAIHDQLTASLDEWAQASSFARQSDTARILDVARAADPDVWRSQLRDAFGRKDAEAIANLARDEQILNQQPETLMLLVRALRVTNQRDRVIELLRRAQPDHPADFWIYTILGQSLMESQPPRADEAAAYYRAAVALRPENVGARLNLGKALVWQSDFLRAEAECRTALQLNPEHAYAHAQLGVTLQLKGDREGALASLREAIRLNPNAAEIHLRAGIAYRGLRMFDEAVAAHREAIRLRPDYFEAHLELGRVYGNRDQFDDAMHAYREAIRLDPQHPEPRTNIASLLLRQRKLDEAERECLTVLKQNPDYSRAYYFLGRVASEQSKWNEALTRYGQALDRNPKNAHAHVGKAVVLEIVGQLDLAMAECRSALRVNPELSWAHEVLGYLYGCKGQWEEAITCRREAVRVAFNKEPRVAQLSDTLSNVAWYLVSPALLSKDRNPNRALTLALEAVNLTPRNRHSWNTLGVAYYRTNDLAKSVSAFEKCMSLRTPDNAYGSFTFAMALWDVVRKEESLKEYEYMANWCHTVGYWNDALRVYCLEAEDKLGILKAYQQQVRDRPQDARAHLRLGRVLLHSRLDATAAIPHLQEAVRLDPKLYEAHFDLGRAYEVKTSWRQAAEAFATVVQLQPNYKTANRVVPVLHGWAAQKDFHSAQAYAQSSQWVKAAELYARGLESEPGHAGNWNRLAILRLQIGDRDGYRRVCQEMLRTFGKTEKAEHANWLALTLALTPDAVADWNPIVQIAEAAVNGDSQNERYRIALGSVLCRAGRYEEAAKRLTEIQPSTEPAAMTWYMLAITHHHQGRTDESRNWLKKAANWTKQEWDGLLDRTEPMSWDRRLVIELLRREAEKLMGAVMLTPRETLAVPSRL